MPGEIKIDDGSGNYTILTNAGSLGSDKTITIPNETATLATTTASNLGGLVKLTSATASNSSELVFDNFVDTSTYHSYIVLFEDILPASNGSWIKMSFRKGGASGSDLAGTYYGMQWASYGNVSTAGFDSNFSQTNSRDVSDGISNTTYAYNASLEFYPANGSTSGTHSMTRYVTRDHNGNIIARMRATYVVDTTATTGLRFFANSGNIASGTFYIFGIKNS